MCPTIVIRNGQPVLAVGGTGGRRIPNAIFEVLAHYVGRDASIEDAVAALRLHTEGDLVLTLEAKWPQEDVERLKKLGYSVRTGPGAIVHAVAVDRKTAQCRAVSR
jgi:gamma-glutamyltranspeptidase/glutathione hydrolase